MYSKVWVKTKQPTIWARESLTKTTKVYPKWLGLRTLRASVAILAMGL
jgi:hypothetical protein